MKLRITGKRAMIIEECLEGQLYEKHPLASSIHTKLQQPQKTIELTPEEAKYLADEVLSGNEDRYEESARSFPEDEGGIYNSFLWMIEVLKKGTQS